MSSVRLIVVTVVNATACILIARGSAEAQTCSINSTVPGPVSCSVTSNVRMTLRIPALVGVTVTSLDAGDQGSSAVVHAGLTVKTNRAYALQIASAPIDPIDPPEAPPTGRSAAVWSTATDRGPLNDTPTQIDGFGEPTGTRPSVQVAFAREPKSGVSRLDPIRLRLTIVAP
jgi:hypothetical protein